MNLNLEQVIQICNAKYMIGENLVNQIDFKNIEIQHLLYDSRRLNFIDNTLFFAFKTTNNDGHKYIKELYSKGIRLFICENLQDLNQFPDAIFLLVKDNTFTKKSLP